MKDSKSLKPPSSGMAGKRRRKTTRKGRRIILAAAREATPVAAPKGAGYKATVTNTSRLPVIKVKLADLTTHPSQKMFYDDLPDAELKALAADIKKHGLRQPIEILPDGTVIDGHQRLRAAKLLGWTHVDVIVRYDLVNGTDADRELAFLQANHLRRHQHPLDRARVAKRLIELRRRRLTKELDRDEQNELRDKIRELLGCSTRNASRYLHVLSAPLRVQHLVRDGHLHLNRGAQVGLLAPHHRERIDRQLSELDDPRRANMVAAAALVNFVGGKGGKPAIKQFMVAIEQANKVSEGRIAELLTTVAAGHLKALVTAKTLIEPLITKAEEARDKKSAAMATLDALRRHTA